MRKNEMLAGRIKAAVDGNADAKACVAELKAFNLSYRQDLVQAVRQENYERIENMLNTYHRLRKTLALLPRTEMDVIHYEAGAFCGTYRVFMDLEEVVLEKEKIRKQSSLLGRKHVTDILDYLYYNPYARQKSIAEGVNVQANYLSEIMNRLLDAGYVERYGKNKSTQYCLTRSGKKVCSVSCQKEEKTDIIVESEYREIQEKEDFLKNRLEKNDRDYLRKEEHYAEWKADFRDYTAASIY